MSILDSLSKKDSYWRDVAYKITKDKSKADELVQEMYLRMYKYDVKEWNYSYIILVLWNLFKDSKKAIRYTDEINDDVLSDVTIGQNFSYSNEEQVILNRIKKLSKDEIELLSLNYELSLGQIAKQLDVCKTKTFRDLNAIRVKVLRGDFQNKYKNRRLKWKK